MMAICFLWGILGQESAVSSHGRRLEAYGTPYGPGFETYGPALGRRLEAYGTPYGPGLETYGPAHGRRLESADNVERLF